MEFINKRWAGSLLALGAAQFMVAMMLGESIAPGYSMHENAISDLGTIAETAMLFNVSLILIGLLNLAAGYVLYKVMDDKKILIIFVLGGIGGMGAGAIPLDNPTGLHGIFALLAFLFMNIEAIVVGRMAVSPLDKASILMGVLGLMFMPIMVMVDGGSLDVSGSIGHGGVERMIAYPALIWMMAFGGYLMASPELNGEQRTRAA
ncbi:MAG: DUF998 domain-containing protein [Methanomassiliicoccales archaeon]|nr:DUF998 domain-containing protein [Methanomassiliicoccales archaeon]